MPNAAVPRDGNYEPIENVVFVPGTGLVLVQGGTVQTDASTGIQYAPIVTSGGGGGGGGGISTNDGTFARETGGNLATLVTQTTGLARESGGNLATLVTQTSGLATQTTLASVKADLDSVVTHDANIDTSTSLIATNTTNANTVLGTIADTAWSLSGTATLNALLKKIAQEIAASLNVQQPDIFTTGTLNAAQPTSTTVAGGTLALTVGQGQSTWRAELSAAGSATFTSGTTIIAEQTIDGTNWTTVSFTVAGQSLNAPTTSITGTGPLEITGSAAGIQQIRLRCTALGSGDAVAVTLRAGVGITHIRVTGSLPPGKSTIGNMSSLAGAIAAASGAPTVTVAATDTVYSFAQQVNRFLIVNSTSAYLFVELDATSSTASIPIPPNGTWEDTIQVTSLHLYTTAAQNINVLNGITIRGWL